MDVLIDYYSILEISRNSEAKDIKKAYYKLSQLHHPDKGGDQNEFNKITDAYKVLIDVDRRSEYDKKSKWGQNYDEYYELLDFEFSNTSTSWDEKKYDKFKDKEVLHKVVRVDDDFNGTVEYDRWVICKECGGNGKDLKSKIEIKDSTGKIIKMFDAEDGCDFCDGSGKGYDNNDCSFCFGKGKIGTNTCKKCNGDKRILGKQKLSGIEFPTDKLEFEVKFMGHFSKDIPGKVGHLYLLKKSYKVD